MISKRDFRSVRINRNFLSFLTEELYQSTNAHTVNIQEYFQVYSLMISNGGCFLGFLYFELEQIMVGYREY